MFLETEGARSVTYWAAWALDHDPEDAFMAANCAKAYASDAAVNVARSALQVHGGIGFTWEHDLHLFLKRAEANAHAYGDARWHREQVADLLLYGPLDHAATISRRPERRVRRPRFGEHLAVRNVRLLRSCNGHGRRLERDRLSSIRVTGLAAQHLRPARRRCASSLV